MAAFSELFLVLDLGWYGKLVIITEGVSLSSFSRCTAYALAHPSAKMAFSLYYCTMLAAFWLPFLWLFTLWLHSSPPRYI